MPRWLRLVERPPCKAFKKAAGQGFKSLSRLIFLTCKSLAVVQKARAARNNYGRDSSSKEKPKKFYK